MSVPSRLTVGALLTAAAQRWPDGRALLTPEGRAWTFADLHADARRVAGALLGIVSPGDRLAVWSPTCWQWYLAQLGAGLAGVTVVTVNPAYRPAELADVLGRSGAAALIYAEEVRGTSLTAILDEVRPQLPHLKAAIGLTDWDSWVTSGGNDTPLPRVTPEDAAQIQYTSGTTGKPKGALLPHGAITANAAAGAQRWCAAPGEVWLNAMPMFHVAGSVINALGALSVGATQLIAPFSPDGIAAAISAHRADLACLAGTMWAMLLDAAGPDDLSSLRLTVAGGQAIPPDLVERIEARTGAPMSILYGMTELCGTIAAVRPDDPDETRLNTCGTPLPGVELRTVDPATDRTLGVGEVGEIEARGWLTMSGYDGDPTATAATLRADGWLRTGDLGSIDAAGRLRVSGRVKEMIIRGGENIYPTEIEGRLRLHPAVRDVAVFGVPDDLYGEVVAAAIVLMPAATAPAREELIAFCREALAPYKSPVHWQFVDALPTTTSGKIQKFRLREAFLASS